MFSLKVVNILCFGSNTELAFEGLISGIFQFKVPVALWEVSQCSLYQYMILYDEVRHLLVWSDINALRQQGLTIQFCTFQSSLSYIIWLHFRILTVFFTDFPGVGRGGWQVFDRIFPLFLLSISAKSCVMDLPFFSFNWYLELPHWRVAGDALEVFILEIQGMHPLLNIGISPGEERPLVQFY